MVDYSKSTTKLHAISQQLPDYQPTCATLFRRTGSAVPDHTRPTNISQVKAKHKTQEQSNLDCRIEWTIKVIADTYRYTNQEYTGS